ncbi:MAG TPA: hypothetical protein DD435_02040 [Cyanobacteria bacterium UBA8530]|nr:hypothetical protein [Cyanobacteria bacterium UBA8530]
MLEGKVGARHLCRLCDRKLIHLGRIVPGELKDTRYYPIGVASIEGKPLWISWIAAKTLDLILSEGSRFLAPSH